ncbi:uncharacterized protein (TIGR02231 family) [Pacificibacter maritimus]|uniref:Uncharacterized protein (TIGR02231 family) n=1 Tax=Pacificibacter maritimus TaxID=762213 RepID=A0A3N4TXF2_9RHOB|nr:DUF4139 domain-containing protein [Pacificibacter maritimus]RPE63132.1 uncharacterized protein (TIGR02231 family) [Pacificibacter maritimus]
MTRIPLSTVFTFLAATALVPTASWSAQFEATSVVSAVTLYPNGAQITRDARITLPAGQHQVTFFDIPVEHENARLQGLQTQVAKAQLGPVQVVNVATSQDEMVVSEAAQSAYDRVESLKAELQRERRNIAAVKLEVDAAEDSLNYISSLKSPEGATPDEIASLAQTIRAESLQARLTMEDAKARTQTAEEDLEALELDLADAQAELSKHTSVSPYRAQVTLNVSLQEEAEVDVTFVYNSAAAFWQPSYKASVDTVDQSLTLQRSIEAGQSTGEPWTDVALRFATEKPSQRTAPSIVPEYLRRVGEIPVQGNMRAVALDGVSKMAMTEAPMASVATEVAQAQSYGVSLSFDYAQPATLYSTRMGTTEFALDPVSLTPDLIVRAVPLYEDTGYLIAKTQNDTDGLFLPGDMQLFRDGALIGQGYLDVQPVGSEFEIAFGAIDGIQVKRTVLDRNEGDRGFIAKSNQSSSEVRLDIENMTSRAWPIEVIDRISVSEQDDLTVDWKADPMPSTQNYEDRRGVLSWQFDLEGGEAESISITENLKWPEGQILR